MAFLSKHAGSGFGTRVRSVALTALSIVLIAGGAYAFLAPAEPPSQAPKVMRVLDKLGQKQDKVQEPKVNRILDKLAAGRTKGDSPTKGEPAADKLVVAVPKDLYSPLGRMTIPAIGVQTPFFNGVFDEIVEGGPGHWPGTPLPGAPGNAAFAGHRTTFTHPFGDLDLLDPGDVVMTKIGRAEPVRFKVFRTTIVPEAEYADFVLKQPSKGRVRMITLFACHPKGYRTHRIVVQAKAPPIVEQQQKQTDSTESLERGA